MDEPENVSPCDTEGQKQDTGPWLQPYRWKPGQSGNTAGGPKGPRSLTQLLKARIEELDENGRQALADRVIEAWLAKVIEGSHGHLQTALERLEGRVPDRLAGHDGGPLTVLIEAARDRLSARLRVDAVTVEATELPQPVEEECAITEIIEHDPAVAAAPQDPPGGLLPDGPAPGALLTPSRD